MVARCLVRLFGAFLVVCALVPRLSSGVEAASSLVAYVQSGDVYVVHADGTGRQRLSTYGLNSGAVLGPNQRVVAFLSVPAAYKGRTGVHNVWLAPVDGTNAQRITEPDAARDRFGLTWSPDGQYLAYWHGTDVVVYDMQAATARVVLQGVSHDPYGEPTIAWSPDSRRIAVAETPALTSDASKPSTLPVLVVPATGGSEQTVVVRFPGTAVNNLGPGRGSLVLDTGISWTKDGSAFLLVTSGAGEGFPLSGIWRVPAGGGLATLIEAGNRVGPAQGGSTPDLAFVGALNVAMSPDFGSIALLARNALYVVPATGNVRITSPAINSGVCEMTSYHWLSDSRGIAYTEACGRVANQHLTYDLQLRVGDRAGGPTRLLAALSAADPEALLLLQHDTCLNGCSGTATMG